MTILDEIFAHKRAEVASRKHFKPQSQLEREAEAARPPLDFPAALQRQASHAALEPHTPAMPALIAEVKLASPSWGVFPQSHDPLSLARLYRANGASGISVVTDERYFHGHLDHLRQITGLPAHLPVLRKDFLFDPYQVYESRFAGADAILLIAAALPAASLVDLHGLALELGMHSLVEVHSLQELEAALVCQPCLVGINNRDLRDFSVDIGTTLRIRPYIPAGVCVVAESGIHTQSDVLRLADAGVDAVLVGEALVSAIDVAAKVQELSGVRLAA